MNASQSRFLLLLTSCFYLFLPSSGRAQTVPYWNTNTKLTPFRLPLVTDKSSIDYLDLTNDGKPNAIRAFLNDSIPILWIDDDGTMQMGDTEGDQVNDCLLIDLNRDGLFAGPGDLCIDWADTNNDGVADVQLIVSNGPLHRRYNFDWSADYMYIVDFGEKDKIKNFVNWRDFALRCWELNGTSNFFSDYHGNTLFLKMHGSSYRIGDLRYSWENPFIFYDMDQDKLSEMTIRLVDQPLFRPQPGQPKEKRFDKIDKEHDVLFSHQITWAAFSWDVDNDNGQHNEFDMDLSIRFTGPGFDYSDQRHPMNNLRGLPASDKLLYDARWRQTQELIYPDEKSAKELVFSRGKWDMCWLVFDEDDDCNRWERVEFYEPLSLFKVGMRNGGLDNNPQADAIGDRGEWDMDNSGHGNLYLAPWDGRIHLYGAEWGAWRIDPGASIYQGYGGLYSPQKGNRLIKEPQSWATVRYEDTDGNGFFDQIEYDLNGDTLFEERVSLIALGIDDKASVIALSSSEYGDLTDLFARATEGIWNRAQQALQVAQLLKLNTDWYAFWQQPRSLHERYEYGYWLNFYIYKDLRQQAEINSQPQLVIALDKAYYGGDWSRLLVDKSIKNRY